MALALLALAGCASTNPLPDARLTSGHWHDAVLAEAVMVARDGQDAELEVDVPSNATNLAFVLESTGAAFSQARVAVRGCPGWTAAGPTLEGNRWASDACRDPVRGASLLVLSVEDGVLSGHVAVTARLYD